MNVLFGFLLAISAHGDDVSSRIDAIYQAALYEVTPTVLDMVADDLSAVSVVLRSQFGSSVPTGCVLYQALSQDPTRFGVEPAQVMFLGQWLLAVLDTSTAVNAIAHAGHHSRTENHVFQLGTTNAVYPEWHDETLISSAIRILLDPDPKNVEVFRRLHRTFLINLEFIRRWEVGSTPRLQSDPSRVQWVLGSSALDTVGEGCRP